jgi:hypothetical protein
MSKLWKGFSCQLQVEVGLVTYNDCGRDWEREVVAVCGSNVERYLKNDFQGPIVKMHLI